MAHWSPDDYADRGMREFPLGSRMVLAFVVAVLWVFSKLMWRWRMQNADELLPEAGAETGSIIICNHTSMAEVVAIYVHEYTHGRRVRAIAKSEFYRTGIVVWLFSRAGTIPVDRGTADMRALRRAQHALKRGEDVLIFPEGTRIRTDDQPVEIHGGFSMIAQMGRSDVVPAAIVGAADPYKTRPTRGKRPLVTFGRPITFESLGVKGRKAQMAEMERAAMAEVYRLRDELRVENPGLW